jgi:Tol biopolymer transport system component
MILTSILLTTSVALAGFVYVRLKDRNSGLGTVPSSQKMRVEKLTNHGRVVRAAVSRDRKYLVYSAREGEQEGLWLKQVSAANNIQIAPGSKGRYNALAFAPDGNSIYYSRFEPQDIIGRLYQIPLLGGTPKFVLADIDSALSFSPERNKLTFFRDNPLSNQYSLIVANIDGTEERTLQTYSGIFLGEGPAWSPDGRVIVFTRRLGDQNRSKSILVSVAVADGKEQTIGSREWTAIGDVAWLPDGRGMVINATDESTDVFSPQIWAVSYPSGEARRITNDLNAYFGVSLTSGLDAVVIESDRIANLWLAPAAHLNNPKQITSGMGDKAGEVLGLSWSNDKRIVYGSTAGGGMDVWAIDAAGNNPKQLTIDPLPDLKPSVSPADGSIVFVSRRTGAPHLWLMNPDGTNPRQLTNGNTESFPSVSPDGTWVAYNSIDDSEISLWKISLSGGQPVRLTARSGSFPSISPDGKLIACFYRDNNQLPPRIALIAAAGGPPLKVFDVPTNIFIEGGLRWLRDGSALTFINDERGVSNIWQLSINGSATKPLTNFSSGQIFRFAWSPDGEMLVFERGITVRDVILISDFS